MSAREGTVSRLASALPRAGLRTLSLALLLALQWAVGTAGPPDTRLFADNPAGTARLEPAQPSHPIVLPREDARGVIGQQQAQPAEKSSSDDAAGVDWARVAVAPLGFAAAPIRATWTAPPATPARAYDPRGPPLRA